MWSGLRLGSLTAQVSLGFLSTICECGATLSTSCCHYFLTTAALPPLPYCCYSVSSLPWLTVSAPPTYLNISSLNPWLLDVHSVQFWLLFVLTLVTIFMVVQGGNACVLTTPSWPEVYHQKQSLFLSVFLIASTSF